MPGCYIGIKLLARLVRHYPSNSVPHSNDYGPKSELWTRMFHFYSLHRAEFLQHYHKRSNVETTFHMIKSKFGQRLRRKSLNGANK